MGRTGGTLYGQHLRVGLEALGHTLAVIHLEDFWPWPHDPERHVRTLLRLPAGLPLLVDGLVWTGLSAAIDPVVDRHHCTVIVHSPLFRETGLTASERDRAFSAEAIALAKGHTVVGTGMPTIHDLANGFGLTAHCIEPGVHPRTPVEAADPSALACLATVTPRKDHLFLLNALSDELLHDRRLACAGSLERSPDHAKQCLDLTHSLGLTHRITWHGELEQAPLDLLLQRTGLVVQTAHFEAYGMAIAEAVAAGIPVVSRPAGALEGPCGAAAVIVDSDDPTVLAQAIASLDHTSLRREARRIAPTLPTWTDVAGRFSRLLGGSLV